jgi:hypothetical protein
MQWVNETTTHFGNDSYYVEPYSMLYNASTYPTLSFDMDDMTGTNLLGRHYIFDKYHEPTSTDTKIVFEDVIVPMAGNFHICWENPLQRSDS